MKILLIGLVTSPIISIAFCWAFGRVFSIDVSYEPLDEEAWETKVIESRQIRRAVGQ